MEDFVRLVHRLDAVTRTNQKVEAIVDYLRLAESEDGAWGVYLLTDQRKKRTVSSRGLRQIFLSHASLPEWLFEECFAHVGDSAETISLLLRSGYLTAPIDSRSEEIMRWSLTRWIASEIPALAGLETVERGRRIVGWWQSLPSEWLFTLNKLITGGFRLGVAKGTVIRALSRYLGAEASSVEEALAGGFTPSKSFLADIASDKGKSPRRPYPFFLANPLAEEMVGDSDLKEWLIEWKWDGIRGQLIHRQGEVTIWSRGEEIVTPQFPEIAEALSKLPDGTVLDAEVVAWDGDAPRPFYALQRRLGRKRVPKTLQEEVPVVAIVFDCLEYDGQDIRPLPIEQRIERIRWALSGISDPVLRPSVLIDAADWDTLETLRRESVQENVEGLMLKRRGSPYRSGRPRGDWWKFKRDPFSLDAVLIYAQAGSGRRANLFTDYTFGLKDGEELVPFAKAYSGLSNEEIADLDRWIRRNTLERFGPVRQVAPERVFEIAFEGIGPSSRHKSGVATRFPRIRRPRPDKSAEEINSLEDARRLIR